ncbi:MAG: pyridoxamine 5'-phosphate oxidase family protein [Caldilineaceae bacterium]|nr:pyridoxamine 5'-phosphate oxidase family protein [Caldilineaceae bacterium]
MAELTTAQVWEEIEKNLFAVLGMVTPNGEARTVGIVYNVQDRKIYIGSKTDAWKVRHIAQNPHVSLTVPIVKRVPFMPWLKIPSATITFSGTAQVMEPAAVDPDALRALYHGMAEDEVTLATTRVIVIEPKGDFVTFGVGVRLLQMRNPKLARGRAPVLDD